MQTVIHGVNIDKRCSWYIGMCARNDAFTQTFARDLIIGFVMHEVHALLDILSLFNLLEV